MLDSIFIVVVVVLEDKHTKTFKEIETYVTEYKITYICLFISVLYCHLQCYSIHIDRFYFLDCQ